MERKFNLNIHSIVDVITNSSTTIFTTAHASQEVIYELFNEVFKLGGGEKKAEDLFEIKIIPDNWDFIIDSFKEEDEYEELFEEEYEKLNTWEEKNRFDEEVILPYLIEEDRWKEYFNDENDTTYEITLKDGSNKKIDFIDRFNNLFGREAGYDG